MDYAMSVMREMRNLDADKQWLQNNTKLLSHETVIALVHEIDRRYKNLASSLNEHMAEKA